MCVVSDGVSPWSPLLDYRFGWRWLLPDLNGNRVLSHGLCEDEQQWWEQSQSITFVADYDESIDGYLVALDSVEVSSIANLISIANPRWLCAWGSGKSINLLRSSLYGFGSLREYALLPSGKPRVVVPLSSPNNAVAGLGLHRPGRWLARAGLLVARGLALLGHYGLLRRNVLLIATREKVATTQGLIQAGMYASILSGHADYALYLGTPDDNRKTVVLPLGDALPSVIFKVADMFKPRSALQNEAQALTAMSVTSLANKVPKLISLDDVNMRLTLVQEFRKRHSVGQARMTHAAVHFLATLSEINRKQVAFADLIKVEECVWKPVMNAGVSHATANAASELRKRFESFSNEGHKIWLHRCHGDFAPWNCSWTAQGFFVYDWEESRKQSLALSDAFYYVLSPYLHVQKNPDAQKALVKAIEFAAEVATLSGLFDGADIDPAGEVRIYCALWLLSRLNQSPFYGELLVLLVRG